MDWAALDEATRAVVAARMLIGGPDSVAEQAQALVALGLDGVCVNLPATGHDPDAVAATIENLAKALA